MKEELISVTFRLPKSKWQKLKNDAEKNMRTLTATIVYRLFKRDHKA